MRAMIILSLLTMTNVATQAQDGKVRVKSSIIMGAAPEATIDKKTKLKTVEWPSTENNSWHEDIGFVDGVPTIADIKAIFPDLPVPSEKYHYFPLIWDLCDERMGQEDVTVLNCYFRMTADVVSNLWLGNSESCILDKETGIIYQARSTVPERCFNKVFGVKGKEGTTFRFKIVFPRLPETAKHLCIYGVPLWYMRGWDVTENALMTSEESMEAYDPVPQFHIARLLKDSVHYDKNNHESWAVYEDAHLIKPTKEETMALWRTKDATYLAISTEQNWIREYHGRGGNTILLDQQGHQYKCKGVVGYPNDKIFWLEGYPGDYFAMVLIFEPLPPHVDTFTYVVPEGEPFAMWGANWSGKVISNLNVEQLRKNQHLFEYHPRTVVR